ncbi:MAG TPA: hypothetical protein VEG27_04330 [Usitatibacter sp.]|nr:hypothetical protein [Usitatibacter sp.]
MEQGAMRNAIVSFFAGLVVAQGVWWIAAGEMLVGKGVEPMRFFLLDGVEVVGAAACFALALAAAGRVRRLRRAPGAVLLSLMAGATTSTFVGPPSALVPQVLPGDAQFVIDIVAAVIASAVFGWLVASAYAAPAAPAETSP